MCRQGAPLYTLGCQRSAGATDGQLAGRGRAAFGLGPPDAGAAGPCPGCLLWMCGQTAAKGKRPLTASVISNPGPHQAELILHSKRWRAKCKRGVSRTAEALDRPGCASCVDHRNVHGGIYGGGMCSLVCQPALHAGGAVPSSSLRLPLMSLCAVVAHCSGGERGVRSGSKEPSRSHEPAAGSGR